MLPSPAPPPHPAAVSRRAFLASLLAVPPLCVAGSLLAQEPVVSGFNMYGSRGYTRALMIGDSLSVGGFGEAMAGSLVAKYGRNGVAMYASCGSSPEHWLRDESNYQTHCGYREITPRTTVHHEHGSFLTPKVEDLIAILHPRTVIIQQGTNWMDSWGDGTRCGEILYRFINAIRSEPGTVRQIFWVTPPDSSHYSRGVQQAVLNLISTGGVRYGYGVINSQKYTHYTAHSGGDGVHYSSEEGRAWAAGVWRELGPQLR